MRLVVTGTRGQVVRALLERAAAFGVEVVTIGRPALDLARPQSIAAAVAAAHPDAVASVAAYTDVDAAENARALASAVNGTGAGAVAAAAAACGVPVLQISSDYVFDGLATRPCRESDRVAPVNAYGRSKAEGEAAVAAANPDHAILRTGWIYSPFGSNFMATMLRLAGTRDVIHVVDDQVGAPTSAHALAEGVLAVARNLCEDDDRGRRGVFHMAAAGKASWADFAEAIFFESRRRGGPTAQVERIPTAGYPTAAARPANSCLDCGKLKAVHGVALGPWREAVGPIVARHLADPPPHRARIRPAAP